MSKDMLPPIIVSGLGRCGSSLVMQILQAGGIAVAGEYPAFECEAYNGGGAPPPRGASKILDLHRNPPPGGPYRWIWLDRSPAQQSKSLAKFMRELCGIRLTRREVRAVANSYSVDRADSFTIKRRLGGPQLIMRFEDIITEPSTSASNLAAFAGIAPVRAMADVVRKRSPDCLPYMLEFDLVAAGPR